jgi:HSP20 family protein
MAAISQFNPFRGFDRLEPFGRDMEEMFKGFFLNGRQLADMYKGFYDPSTALAPLSSGRFPVDISEDETAFKVRAEIPGFKKDEIKVSVDGNQVSISAETRKEREQKNGDQVIMQECFCGKQYRAFTLPKPVDDTKTAAKYCDGVLELTLPKKAGAASANIAIT